MASVAASQVIRRRRPSSGNDRLTIVSLMVESTHGVRHCVKRKMCGRNESRNLIVWRLYTSTELRARWESNWKKEDGFSHSDKLSGAALH
jgi:hypothetical protein